MSFKKHLMDDEDVLDYCGTDYWIWICTDRRVLKYREGSGSAEQLHDISFGEISSISLVNTGRDDILGGYAVFSAIAGLLLSLAGIGGVFNTVILLLLAGFAFVVAWYYFLEWRNSERSYFEFKGSGLIQSNSDQWRIDQTDADNSDEIREFTKTVRSQL